MDKRQCENCDEDFDTQDSDANKPQRFCSLDCQHDSEDRMASFNDAEFRMDHDHSMDH